MMRPVLSIDTSSVEGRSYKALARCVVVARDYIADGEWMEVPISPVSMAMEHLAESTLTLFMGIRALAVATRERFAD